MLLWIGLALMTAAAVAAVTRPLWRAPSDPSSLSGADATSIYRDQIGEIDRDIARGVIEPVEAEAARVEVARRLLEADAKRQAEPADQAAGAGAFNRRLAIGLTAGLPVAAIALYLLTGSPDLPGQPLSARVQQPTAVSDVADLVRAVEQRLRQHPEDGQGWDVIAPVYFKQGRFRDAADAFNRAALLLGETPRRLAGFAEATVLVNDGIVTDPARIAYEKLAKLEPDRIEPRFWLALAKEQDGKLEAAITDYENLLGGAPPDANWRQMVVQRIEEARAKLGKSAVAKPETPGPTADDIAAAERLSATDRKVMIESMVDGLAKRLKDDGRDLAGWQRLILAYAIMGRKSDAVAALVDARSNFKDEPQPLAQLTELAKSLGLDS